ncbi:hypothetical protein HC248_01987 [Polaromonas vacuolata]|uniref:Uncharacterized protein n=1 Tax=Polaromonas vacuolata TaxID=37448 RepID=A0A6H2H9X4_9BURK|nr:hypothetical protein HC248_01885 [Polaromonas vacuolata]QJC56678.1 hypothetical protein HC248_01987 [Polaromonas vacuolata]
MVAKTQNGTLVEQTPKRLRLRKISAQPYDKEEFFYGEIGERKPLLHEVNTPHSLLTKWWPPGPRQ